MFSSLGSSTPLLDPDFVSSSIVSSLDPNFVTGFIDAEGTFTVNITDFNTGNQPLKFIPTFTIGLHSKDKDLLESIKKIL